MRYCVALLLCASAVPGCAKPAAQCLATYSVGRDAAIPAPPSADQLQQWFEQLAYCGVATQNGRPPSECTVGTLRPAARTAVKPRTIVEALITSETIQTYMHLDSSVCLARESTENGVYRAQLTGTHSYCTNECITDPLKFTVRIATDGVVRVGP